MSAAAPTPTEASPSPSRGKGKLVMPASAKFSFKSAFGSARCPKIPSSRVNENKPALPESPSKRSLIAPPAPTAAPTLKLAWPGTENLAKESKLPTSTMTLRSKTVSMSRPPSITTLGKRASHQPAEAEQTPAKPASDAHSTSAADSANNTGEFGATARPKMSSLRSKLPGPPPARFGTYSGRSSKPAATAASPSGKVSKIARSDSLSDVHGAAAEQVRITMKQGAGPAAATKTFVPSDSTSNLRSAPLPRAGSLPKSRSRTGSALTHRGTGDATAGTSNGDAQSRKRTQSVAEAPHTTSPRKASGSATVASTLKTKAVPVSHEPAVEQDPAAALSQVGNLTSVQSETGIRKPTQRRPSSVDLGNGAKPHSRRSSIDQASSRSAAVTCSAQAAGPESGQGKENQAVGKAGPPPSLLGSGVRTLRKTSVAMRNKRSSLPVPTAAWNSAAAKDARAAADPSDDAENTGSTPPTATDTAEPSDVADLAPTERREKVELGIARSVLKDHPITHPAVLAMRQKAPYQPIDTPQALIKGKKRLSGVLANPLNLAGSAQKADASRGRPETSKVATAGTVPSSAKAPVGSRAGLSSHSNPGPAATLPVSPSKARLGPTLAFPSRGPLMDRGPAAQPPTQGTRAPSKRALSSAEIDADLLASLQAVARKANLDMKTVELMLATDDPQLGSTPPEIAAAMPRVDTWSTIHIEDESLPHLDSRERFGGAQTPSLSQMSISALARGGGHARRNASEDEQQAENIGDQSLDFREIGSSPAGAESPLLHPSDSLSPHSPVSATENAVAAAPDNDEGHSDSASGSRRRPRPSAPASERSRRAPRESVGLEMLLSMKSSESHHESLLGIDLDSAMLRPGKSRERLRSLRSSTLLADESFAEEISVELVAGIDGDEDAEPDSDRELDIVVPLSKAPEEIQHTRSSPRAPRIQSDNMDAMLREMQDEHASQVAELRAQLATLAAQLAEARLTAEQDAVSDQEGPQIDHAASELRAALEAARGDLFASDEARRRLEAQNVQMSRGLDEAQHAQATHEWAGIKRLGLVELQEIKSQADACIFWTAQLDLWEGMANSAANRRRRAWTDGDA